jgi:signal-transduction protein with cAMP-binding, CBS, and nucleotidyltransferase domain
MMRMKDMAEIGLRSKMLVKDVMSSPVVTSQENAPISKVAQLMDENDLGCIIVANKQGKPLGIITEKDLVARILAKNVKPDSMKASEVMTSPLITVDPDTQISEVARTMSRLNVRRLGVIYKGQLVGLISSKDILAVMPELMEMIQEQARIEFEKKRDEEGEEETEESRSEEDKSEVAPLAGYCDHCGAWSDNLSEVGNEYICEDCKAESESEE